MAEAHQQRGGCIQYVFLAKPAFLSVSWTLGR
jgi:hypothetical protein